MSFTDPEQIVQALIAALPTVRCIRNEFTDKDHAVGIAFTPGVAHFIQDTPIDPHPNAIRTVTWEWQAHVRGHGLSGAWALLAQLIHACNTALVSYSIGDVSPAEGSESTTVHGYTLVVTITCEVDLIRPDEYVDAVANSFSFIAGVPGDDQLTAPNT